MLLPLSFPADCLWMCGSGRDEEPSGEEALRLIQIRLATLNFEKISPARQGNLPRMRIGELFGGLDYAAVAQRIRRTHPVTIRLLPERKPQR